MKLNSYFGILTLVAILSACAPCEQEIVVVVQEPTKVIQVVPEPEPVVPEDTAGVVYCAQASSSCPTSPVPLPRPVINTPVQEPTCTRDTNIPLVVVNGVLTDNCGNKYGGMI